MFKDDKRFHGPPAFLRSPERRRLKSEDIRDIARRAGFGGIRIPEMKHMVLVLLEAGRAGSGYAGCRLAASPSRRRHRWRTLSRY